MTFGLGDLINVFLIIVGIVGMIVGYRGEETPGKRVLFVLSIILLLVGLFVSFDVGIVLTPVSGG